MRVFLILLPAILLAQAPPAARPAQPKPVGATAASAVPAAPELATDDDKTIYALGLSVYRSLAPFDLSAAELEILKQALTDAAAGKPALKASEWGSKIQMLGTMRGAVVAAREKSAGTAYLDKAAAQPGAIKTASGLVYRELAPGSGASPKASDMVKVHYRGTFVNGTEFDSSYRRNAPAEFPLNGVIRCWTEGVQKMKVGGKAELVCPSALAYGDRGNNAIPGGATLIFEVELLGIGPATPPALPAPAAPAKPAAPTLQPAPAKPAVH
jgi:FKBP-type peptidyl-prolyl cis-trans isomerase FkpA